jgi:pilus assembly protein CpaB
MRRPIIFVLLAGFAALVAAMVVYSALKKREAEVQQAKLQSVEIVVAAHALGIGTKLDASSVRSTRWSRDSMPPGAFTDPSAVIGKYTKNSFVENQPIVADWLFSGDKNAGVLPLLIPTGMRALSVPVDEVSDIAGFVLPHAHVDVLVTVTSGEKPLTKIVLQDVEVLAIAQDIEQVNDKPQPVHVVTMLVTPDQAERLTLASGQGGLRLALRNYDDKNVIATNGVTVAQLLGAQPAALPMAPEQHVVFAAPRPRPKPVSVEVMRNGTSTEAVTFVRAKSGGGESMEPEAASSPPDVASPAADPGKSDGSDSFISEESRAPSVAATAANAPASGNSLAAFAASGVGTVAPESVMMNSAAGRMPAPAGSPAVGAGYTGPTSKTIDVP